jgi:hypothetical protein
MELKVCNARQVVGTFMLDGTFSVESTVPIPIGREGEVRGTLHFSQILFGVSST